MKEYRRRPTATVVAIQMNLLMTGLLYEKWGGLQVGKPGDWLVENAGEVYTVDRESFAKTYAQVEGMPGRFSKIGAVWAMEADSDGEIKTKEGYSSYQKGDMLVFNQDQSDGYCMSQEKFFELYEREGTAITA